MKTHAHTQYATKNEKKRKGKSVFFPKQIDPLVNLLKEKSKMKMRVV